ncbi:MAG: type II glyceraldehyde-3-phosphate dehydrogenase [Candidatus Aenigmarchaeota archaeon]|nr:type II glyceraldehyde-3-phosphate dehydrogenase [Candidatus Aenigmarchaeota archaeon]
MFKIGVNGFGTIGKRVASAVQKQKDMKLLGISDISPSWESRYAAMNVPVYMSLKEYGKDEVEQFEKVKKTFIDAGIEPAGAVTDLIDEANLIVDATPEGIGRKNKEEIYSRKKSLHAIFQGGEKASIAKVTFNANINYKDAVGEQFIRVPSCNTTGMLRYLNSIQEVSDVKDVIINLIRRGADPAEPNSGPINDYVPTEIPSHHADDVIVADKRLEGKLITYGVKVPVTLMHMHNVVVTGDFPSRDKILDAFDDNLRIIVLGGENGAPTAAEIIDANDRRDLYQIIILEKTVHLHGNILLFSAYVHQEADVIPENIDAIRASLGFEDSYDSIIKTNESLGLKETKKRLEELFPVS